MTPAAPATRSIRMSAAAREAIAAAVRARPDAEACGLLLGADWEGERRVAMAVSVANGAADARGRYFIDAATLRLWESRAAGRGLDVVGVYHSHPDGSTAPSGTDRDAAWPWYSYVIAAPGAEVRMRAWRLLEDRSGFEPQPLEVAPWR